jgi:protein-L-isoaspartate O-methyltransferase
MQAAKTLRLEIERLKDQFRQEQQQALKIAQATAAKVLDDAVAKCKASTTSALQANFDERLRAIVAGCGQQAAVIAVLAQPRCLCCACCSCC